MKSPTTKVGIIEPDGILYGSKIKDLIIKTINKIGNIDFAKLSGDFNPLHMDEDYALNTNFEKRVCHGMLLASFFSQLVGMYLPGKNSLYFSQSLNFRNPCFVDDEVIIAGDITEKKSNTRIITIKTTISRGTTIIIDGTAKVIVRE